MVFTCVSAAASVHSVSDFRPVSVRVCARFNSRVVGLPGRKQGLDSVSPDAGEQFDEVPNLSLTKVQARHCLPVPAVAVHLRRPHRPDNCFSVRIV